MAFCGFSVQHRGGKNVCRYCFHCNKLMFSVVMVKANWGWLSTTSTSYSYFTSCFSFLKHHSVVMYSDKSEIGGESKFLAAWFHLYRIIYQ